MKQENYLIQVGDKIHAHLGDSGSLFSRYDVVTRVTKTMAICDKPNSKPVRYPRLYTGLGFHSLPYQRSTMRYTLIKKDTL